MKISKVVWPFPVREKLLSFRSVHFTPEESYNFIIQVIKETEELLLNPVVKKVYTEEFGEYKGMSRFVIRKFRFYFEQIDDKAVVIAVKFPGEK